MPTLAMVDGRVEGTANHSMVEGTAVDGPTAEAIAGHMAEATAADRTGEPIAGDTAEDLTAAATAATAGTDNPPKHEGLRPVSGPAFFPVRKG